jgi:hypothetical protein
VLREFMSVLTRPHDTKNNTSTSNDYPPLTQLTMQGFTINNSQACAILATILQYNRSLTSWRLDDPKNPRFLTSTEFQTIIQQGLKHHYAIKDLVLDVGPSSSRSKLLLRQEMEFYLCLNRAGRQLLQQDNNVLVQSKQAWIETLARARHWSSGGQQRIDVLFWLIRNGVNHLF